MDDQTGQVAEIKDWQKVHVNLSKTVEVIHTVEKQVAAILTDIKALPLPEALRAYHVIKTRYEQIDKIRKAIYASLEHLSKSAIPEMMDSEQVKTVTVEYAPGEAYRFTKSVLMSASMPDKEGGMKWLRENGQGGLIQETVNSSSLSAFARQYINDEGMELPEEYFKVSTVSNMSVTKA